MREDKTENELSLKFRFRLMSLSGYRRRKDLGYHRNGPISHHPAPAPGVLRLALACGQAISISEPQSSGSFGGQTA